MEFDSFKNYLKVLREQRKTPREREIEKQIAEISMKHQRALADELAPLLAELVKLESAKGPMPVVIDGNMYEYVGPVI